VLLLALPIFGLLGCGAFGASEQREMENKGLLKSNLK